MVHVLSNKAIRILFDYCTDLDDSLQILQQRIAFIEDTLETEFTENNEEQEYLDS